MTKYLATPMPPDSKSRGRFQFRDTRSPAGSRRNNRMSHQIAKLLLEHAATFLDRTEAIKAAMDLGMPLDEIESYLDWLDTVRRQKAPNDEPKSPPPPAE
jgi:hypothetical protein